MSDNLVGPGDQPPLHIISLPTKHKYCSKGVTARVMGSSTPLILIAEAPTYILS